MKITVTEDLWHRAKDLCDSPGASRYERCPLALALREKTKKPWRVRTRYATCGTDWKPLSQEAQDFIEQFDWERDIPEFPITLEVFA